MSRRSNICLITESDLLLIQSTYFLKIDILQRFCNGVYPGIIPVFFFPYFIYRVPFFHEQFQLKPAQTCTFSNQYLSYIR
ncbi:hypothetical protein T05_11143 [Trichinella murrelli]|uniref:Uncharacterized protein n=1 Tax=Trichinella murrelli TaxID=144512 RepID=A0A0V0TME2_9BILA|nr:hypothetical protein T05_11143 [Trichinella murrelli]